jgi:hypothetical protein
MRGMFWKNKGLASFLIPFVEKVGKTLHAGELKSYF